MATNYPAEPWDLRGQLHASAFLVPLADVPVDLPPGYRPVRVGNRGLVGTAWVDYEPGGVLAYREIMATLLVRRGWRVLPTIVAIWVDSAASQDGGRALWAIPKELATFDFDGGSFSAWDEKGGIAYGAARPRWRLPRRWPVAFSIVQSRDGRAVVSPVRARAGVALASASFDPDPSGPLGFLVGRRPLASFSLRDFVMCFGMTQNGTR